MKPTIKAQILRTLQQHSDLSTIEVAHRCQLSYATTRKYLQRMVTTGEITVHGRGVFLYTAKGRAA